MSEHTQGEWTYGVRKDGSIWLSIGDRHGNTGHYQGDFVGTEADARLTVAAPDLLHFARWVDSMCSDPAFTEKELRRHLTRRALELIYKARGDGA